MAVTQSLFGHNNDHVDVVRTWLSHAKGMLEQWGRDAVNFADIVRRKDASNAGTAVEALFQTSMPERPATKASLYVAKFCQGDLCDLSNSLAKKVDRYHQ